MRLTLAATALLAGLAATASVEVSQAQVSPTGRRMPLPGQTGAAGTAAPGAPAAGTPTQTFTEAQQREATLKAQRAAQARDKAWDQKMKRTMSSICHGC